MVSRTPGRGGRLRGCCRIWWLGPHWGNTGQVQVTGDFKRPLQVAHLGVGSRVGRGAGVHGGERAGMCVVVEGVL